MTQKQKGEWADLQDMMSGSAKDSKKVETENPLIDMGEAIGNAFSVAGKKIAEHLTNNTKGGPP